jgi:acetyl-CoA C-acetyltransferase
VAHLDLYSCFASSINLARDALGLGDNDGRPLTVTGGLPFSGGAGSNYMMHSVATMTNVLRARPGDTGLVTGVGMHMTKHVFGLYSATPGPVLRPDTKTVQARLDALPVRAIADTYEGPSTVATYTVAHGRDGKPEWGLAICDLPDGSSRAYARIDKPDLLAAIEASEFVGSTVQLTTGPDNVNLVNA